MSCQNAPTPQHVPIALDNGRVILTLTIRKYLNLQIIVIFIYSLLV
jgi:hypothetical protein